MPGMRLWSLHPKHLDSRGLVALWREGLLAQAVLRGRTKGYRHHPQLIRFRAQPSPVSLIAEYLRAVHAEAVRRGYRFDAGRIACCGSERRIDVSRGQVDFEWNHLMTKARNAGARVARTAARGDSAAGASAVPGDTRRSRGLGTCCVVDDVEWIEARPRYSACGFRIPGRAMGSPRPAPPPNHLPSTAANGHRG